MSNSILCENTADSIMEININKKVGNEQVNW